MSGFLRVKMMGVTGMTGVAAHLNTCVEVKILEAKEKSWFRSRTFDLLVNFSETSYC